MPIHILAIGKKHDTELMPLINEYEKRLRSPWKPEWRIVPAGNTAQELTMQDESSRLLSSLPFDAFVILLDERGRMLDTPALSDVLNKEITASRNIIFIIGGAFGVTDEMRQRANVVLSLSKLVFPHQMVRYILIEQIYRCWTISAGLKYHHL